MFDVKAYYKKYYETHKPAYALSMKKYFSKPEVIKREKERKAKWLLLHPDYFAVKAKEWREKQRKNEGFITIERERCRLYSKLKRMRLK